MNSDRPTNRPTGGPADRPAGRSGLPEDRPSPSGERAADDGSTMRDHLREERLRDRMMSDDELRDVAMREDRMRRGDTLGGTVEGGSTGGLPGGLSGAGPGTREHLEQQNERLRAMSDDELRDVAMQEDRKGGGIGQTGLAGTGPFGSSQPMPQAAEMGQPIGGGPLGAGTIGGSTGSTVDVDLSRGGSGAGAMRDDTLGSDRSVTDRTLASSTMQGGSFGGTTTDDGALHSSDTLQDRTLRDDSPRAGNLDDGLGRVDLQQRMDHEQTDADRRDLSDSRDTQQGRARSRMADLDGDGQNDTQRMKDGLKDMATSHPTATAVGAVAGAVAAGAAVGTVAGPIGTLIGAALGAAAGGLTGKGVADMVDPTLENDFWRTNWQTRDYVKPDMDYDRDYGPAYRYGVDAYTRYPERHYEDMETDLSSGWHEARGESRLEWDHAKHASRDAWHRVKDKVERALPGDSDGDGR